SKLDGMPLVRLLRRRGAHRQQRVAGMDLLSALCAAAERERSRVFFLGSTPDVLEAVGQLLRREHPRLRLAGMESPPFREPTPNEDAALVARIVASEAGIVFRSLGCPEP